MAFGNVLVEHEDSDRFQVPIPDTLVVDVDRMDIGRPALDCPSLVIFADVLRGRIETQTWIDAEGATV